MRLYNPAIGKFLSVDPIAKKYPMLTPYQFAGNTPIQAIDLDGYEPKSVVKEKSRETIVISSSGRPWYKGPVSSTTTTVVTYQFTEGATHLLSLVSGIPEEDIRKTNVRISDGILPAYDPRNGGGGITFPEDDGSSYRINLTANYFQDFDGAGEANRKDNIYAWLRINAHEVGHIQDIKEISRSKTKYFAVFLAGYIEAGSHNGHPREGRADKGKKNFVDFRDFVDSYYGIDKLKDLFENKNNTDKDIIKRIDQWWSRYQKEIKSEKSKTKTK